MHSLTAPGISAPASRFSAFCDRALEAGCCLGSRSRRFFNVYSVGSSNLTTDEAARPGNRDGHAVAGTPVREIIHKQKPLRFPGAAPMVLPRWQRWESTYQFRLLLVRYTSLSVLTSACKGHTRCSATWCSSSPSYSLAHARATGATGDRAHSQQIADFALWHHPTQRPGSAALGWGRHLTRCLNHGQRVFRGGLSHTDRSTDSSTHHPKFQRYPEPGRSTAERHPARCGLHLHHRRTTAHDMVFTEPRPLAWSGSGGGPLPLSSADHAATPRVDRKRGAIPGIDVHTKSRLFWPGGARHQRRTGGAGGVGAQRQNRDLRRRRMAVLAFVGCALASSNTKAGGWLWIGWVRWGWRQRWACC